MRYKKEQDKPFYILLDAFKTVKPAEKEQTKATSALGHTNGTGNKESGAKSAAEQAEEKKQRIQAIKQLRK